MTVVNKQLAARVGFVLAFVLLCTGPFFPLYSAEVGSSNGSFAVGHGGQGSWALPLSLPPGVGGVAPNLAIQVGTGGGDGPLGKGGSLAGLSSITRCAATIVQDGFNRGVFLEKTDGYCLDGNRLVLVAGQYGADGSEYRTEIESYKKVIARSGIGDTGPRYFEVVHRNGSTVYFGEDEAFVKDQVTGAIIEWKVKRLSDPNGNSVAYEYGQGAVGNDGGNELVLSGVKYGGNDPAGTAHFAEIKFTYREDDNGYHYYRLGNLFKQSVKLENIEIRYEGDLVRNYVMYYGESEIGKSSRIEKIEECNGEGACYPPILFAYTPEVSTWSSVQYNEPSKLKNDEGRPRGVIADINNDGWNDWVISVVGNNGVEEVATWLGGASGWQRDSRWDCPAFLFDYTIGPQGVNAAQFVDVNGDGWVDVVMALRDSNGDARYVWINTGNGWQADASWQIPDVLFEVDSLSASTTSQGLFSDLNGDGRIDMLVSIDKANGEMVRKAWINNGRGWVLDQRWTPPSAAVVKVQADDMVLSTLLDVNGDGLSDWMETGAYSSNTTQTAQPCCLGRVWLNTGSGWREEPKYQLPIVLVNYTLASGGVVTGSLADVNGDGLTDVLQAVTYANGSKVSKAWLNTGRGWLVSSEYALPESLLKLRADGKADNLGSIVDIDSDGRPDFIQSYISAALPAPGATVFRQWRKNESGGWQEVNASGSPAPFFVHYAEATSAALLDAGDLNGDGMPELFVSHQGKPAQLYQKTILADGQVAGKLASVTNGLGLKTTIQYGTTTDQSVYRPLAFGGATYPVVADNTPKFIIKSVLADDGMGGVYQVDHQYGEARIHRQGRGFLGFAWHTVLDHRSGIAVQNEFYQEFPFVGMSKAVIKEIEDANSGQSRRLTEVVTVADGLSQNNGKTVYPFAAEVTSSHYDLGGNRLAATVRKTSVDGYGNVTRTEEVASSSGDTVTTVEETEFLNLTASEWRLGLPTSVAITVDSPQYGRHVKKLRNEYDYQGRLAREILEPDYDHLSSEHEYDIFGNRIKTTVHAPGYPDRNVTTTYSPDGRFPIATKNSLGHVVTNDYDGRFGVVTKTVSPNGKTRLIVYDAFGIKINERVVDPSGQSSDGTKVAARFWCDGNAACPPGAAFFIATIGNEQDAPVAAYYDAYGREVRGVTYGMGGRVIFQDTQYDLFGRKAKVSAPYFKDGETPKWNTVTYDLLDRMVSQSAPDGAVTTYQYNGATTTINRSGKLTKVTANGLGKPAESVDAQGNVTRFTYDVLGNLLTTTDPHGNVIATEYDHFGRKTQTNDPDMGLWRYGYDPFGNVIEQVDAKGQQTLMEYDQLGRLVKRVTPEGETRWLYDSAVNGIGLPAKVTGPDGYVRLTEYDRLERPVKSIAIMDGVTYTTETGYLGTTDKVLTVVYPSGLSARYSYDEWGNQTEIQSEDYAKQQAYVNAATIAQAAKATAEKRQADTAARLANLQNAYNEGVASLKPYQDRIAAYRAEYDQTVPLATDAADKVNYYNGLVGKYNAEYATYYNNYKSHLSLADQYKAKADSYWYDYKSSLLNAKKAELSGNTAGVEYWTKKAKDQLGQYNKYVTLVNKERTDANSWATLANTAAANAQANATLRDQWSTKLTTYNNRIVQLAGTWQAMAVSQCAGTYDAAKGLCLVANGLIQNEEAAMLASAGYKQAIAAQQEHEAIVKELNTLVEQANTAIATANSLYDTYLASVTQQWQNKQMNASRQITLARLGNGVETARSYDAMGRSVEISTITPYDHGGGHTTVQALSFTWDNFGNLTQRRDGVSDLIEQFTYDVLDRVVRSDLSGSGAALYQQIGLASTSYGYDEIGNLTLKSDAGEYTYSGVGGPHAVKSIANGPRAGTFTYDANGNLLTGNGRTIAWNSFNKPVLVTGHGGKVEMAYGPEQQLIRTVDRSAVTPVTTTYVNPVFEVVSSGGSTEYRHNLKAGNETVAVVRQGGSGPSTLYLHRDHLDSIVAVTDSQGQVVDRRHYDAFGKVRHGVAAPGSAEALTPLLRDHGYTGHKQLASVSLVHMGGRVYDPEVGRFLSADPFVQAPLFTQSYNRYSYVLNNPLSLNDPSGYFSFNPFKWVANVVKAVVDFVGDVVHAVVKAVGNVFREIGKFVAKYWRPIVAVVVTVVVAYCAPYALAAIGPELFAAGSTASIVATGALAGAAGGLVATGTLKGALIGGVTGAAFAGVGSMFQNVPTLGSAAGRAIVSGAEGVGSAVSSAGVYAATAAKTFFHGVVGGLSTVLSGGRFEQGFLAAGFTEAFSPAIAYAGDHYGLVAEYGAASVAGGVGSEIAGGRFQDGAVMGVFSRALNHGVHDRGDVARSLSTCEKEAFGLYFPSSILDKVVIHDGYIPPWLPDDMAAVTLENDIYFRPGELDTSSAEGMALLGHEIFHVTQYESGVTRLDFLWSYRAGYSEDTKYEKPANDYQRGIQLGLEKTGFKGCP